MRSLVDCNFFLVGHCRRDDCAFRHAPQCLETDVVCDSWVRANGRKCDLRGNCSFRHPPIMALSPGRAAASSTSTVPCMFFAAGNCRLGSACKFSHGAATAAAASTSRATASETSEDDRMLQFSGAGGLSYGALRAQFPFSMSLAPGQVPMLRQTKEQRGRMCETQADQAEVLLAVSRAMVSGQLIEYFRDDEARRVGLNQAQTVLLRSLTATMIDLRLELRYNEFAFRRIGQLPIRNERDNGAGEIARWVLDVCSSFVDVQAWGPHLDTIVMSGGIILVSSRRRCEAIAALTEVSVVCRGLHGRRLPSLVIDHICTFIVADNACTPEARFQTIQRINEHFRH